MMDNTENFYYYGERKSDNERLKTPTQNMDPSLAVKRAKYAKSNKGIKRKRVSTLNCEVKKKRPTVHFTSDNELLKIGLGNEKFLTVNTYDHQNYVDFRKYEGKYPTKHGIPLCPIRAKTLFEIVENIDKEAETCWRNSIDGEKEYRFHLGYATFVDVFEAHGERFYDIRRWWKPENSIKTFPTKYGLCMNVQEFERFKEYIPTIEGLLPELIQIRHCDCWFLTDPNLTCERCFPFVFDNE